MSVQVFNPKSHKLNFSFSYNNDETSLLRKDLKDKENVDSNDLRRVSLWKLDRVLSVSDETLECIRTVVKMKELRVDSDCSKKAIEMLVNSQGIGFPMASAILKFLRPDVFPIIDVRAYRALEGKKLSYAAYTLDKYIAYTKKLTDLANTLKLPLSEIDEQLYCFDKAKNGKI